MAPLNLRTYVRKIPPAVLKQHLSHRGVALPGDLPPETETRKFQDAVATAVEESTARSAGLFISDAERIDQLADEAFEEVLENLEDPPPPSGLTSRHARIAVAFLTVPDAFRRAELARFTDTKRRKRMWDGYRAAPGLQVGRDEAMREQLKAALRALFRSSNVEVDIFTRRRPTIDGTEISLVHMTVFREGRPVVALRFNNGGQLGPTDDWPVFEAALTYEPATGSLEVVTQDVDGRPDFVRVCAETLLGVQPGEKLPLRQFQLDRLRQPFAFETDADDGIERVDVTLIRLMPIDTETERVVLQCLQDAPGTIWDMAARRFAEHSPLGPAWIVTQAKLTVRFRKDASAKGAGSLSFTVTAPHGCDLKDGTDRERLIGEKYLRRWGILAGG